MTRSSRLPASYSNDWITVEGMSWKCALLHRVPPAGGARRAPATSQEPALRIRLIERDADDLRNAAKGPMVHVWGVAVELSPTGTTRQPPEYFQ